MRLDFNILWVEDQQDAVKATSEKIDKLLRKEGFRAKYAFTSSVEDAEEILGADVYGDHVDLVLMDYDLGDGPNGSVGIEKVRDKFFYKDIVFYSASGVSKLDQAVKEGNYKGVFTSSRQELPDVVNGVFRELVKKVLDIEHSRGIVMSATSEIDYFVNESLYAAYDKSSDEHKNAALNVVSEHLAEIKERFQKDVKVIEQITEVSQLDTLRNSYTSVHRLRLLRKMLISAGIHEPVSSAIKKYIAETLPLRNSLAHVRVECTGFSRKLYASDGDEITYERMRDLRISLLEYQEIMQDVSVALRSPPDES